MKSRHLSLGAGLVVPALLAFAGMGTGAEADTPAVTACTTANGHQPAKLVAAIDDGLGGSLVWLTDADANLWVCSADAAGKIYAYVMMSGDLLKGAGSWLVLTSPSTMTSSAWRVQTRTLSISQSLPARPFSPAATPAR
jgi:hypothetical protein